ncbi:MAG: hypothetical protein JKP90_16310 [Desulfofustis sp. PB-SRB1]|nr:hypothetical protein [Desulfofustis sp. PB-SRB1]
MDEQHSVARLVHELRERTGLRQEKFAVRPGVTFATRSTAVRTNAPSLRRWCWEKIESLLRNLGDNGKALHSTYIGKEA